MRKLNGITINGEYLGNSVVINGMFRAICTISPVIMRDFVQIINKIERLDEAVKINNFNCGFDSIDIEFKNSNAQGIASLYFKLINGEPELTDCRLIIDDKEYSTLSETIIVPELTSPNLSTDTEPSEDDIARRQKISELKAKKLEKLRQEKAQKMGQRPPAQRMGMQNPAQRNNPMSPAGIQNNAAPKSKREELLERKRQIMEARAQKLAGGAQSPAMGNQNGIAADSSLGSAAADGTLAKEASATEAVAQKQNDAKGLSQNDRLDANTASGDTDTYNSNDTDPSVDDNSYAGDTKSKFDNLDDIDLENMTDEELAELEAELEAEMESEGDGGYDGYDGMSNDDYYNGYPSSTPMFDSNFAQSLSQGLVDGLTQGLSQGLAQGLAQGLSQGLGASSWGGGGGNNQSFGAPSSDYGFSDNSFGSSSAPQGGFGNAGPSSNASYQQLPPDYSSIDNLNVDAALSARESYSYDENSDMDDLSDLYSDFYEENQIDDDELIVTAGMATGTAGKGPNTSEVDALKAELDALKAEAGNKKDLMTLDEFLAKQKELADAKEKKRRQKLRIVGSRERVNASALDGGVFVSGNKVYKWGDPKVLDE